MLHDTPPTHQRGGTLNALITHDVTECPDCVTVDDVRLSDHSLLCWKVNTTHAAPPLVLVSSRPWRQLDMELFRSALSESRLCQPRSTADVDELAALYDNELTRMLDQTLPARHYLYVPTTSVRPLLGPRVPRCQAIKPPSPACIRRRQSPCSGRCSRIFCRRERRGCQGRRCHVSLVQSTTLVPQTQM